MIISNNIKKAKVPFPSIEGIGGPSFVGKIKLKNVYQQWTGENINEITQKSENNPFNLRIGLPQMDRQMKEDRIFLFTKYLAYNPLTKEIEKRELISLRNVEKIYIGQSPEEQNYKDYRLFVDGKAVLEDIAFKQPNANIPSLVDVINKLLIKVEKLENEIDLLKQKSKEDIYK